MSEGLDRFNAMTMGEAQDRLYACLANQPWARQVADGRPYRNVDQLLAAAEAAWTELKPGDWLQAFKAHPRIGEGGGHAPASSEHEQSGVRQASASTLAALAAENRAYEARFGHVFLIAARGRSADEILRELRRRSGNDAFTEVEVATAEHKKITRMRLMELVE